MNFIPRAVAKRKVDPCQPGPPSSMKKQRTPQIHHTELSISAGGPSPLTKFRTQEPSSQGMKGGGSGEESTVEVPWQKCLVLEAEVDYEKGRVTSRVEAEEKQKVIIEQLRSPCDIGNEPVPTCTSLSPSSNTNSDHSPVSRVCPGTTEYTESENTKGATSSAETLIQEEATVHGPLEQRLRRLEQLSGGIASRFSLLTERTIGHYSEQTATRAVHNTAGMPQTANVGKGLGSRISDHECTDSVGRKSSFEIETGTRSTHVRYHRESDVSHEDREDEEEGALYGDDDDEDNDNDGMPPVSFSKNQRWPEEDEPVCIVCGKYGEYICSQTDADICSLECKAKNLVRRGMPVQEPKTSKSPCCSSPADQETAAWAEEAVTTDPADDAMTTFVYREHREISSLTSEQVQDIRNEVQLFVEGMNVQRPVLEFKQLGLPNALQGNLEASGYMTPTPIQMQAIPIGLALRDLMVCAQTSSGKTASFLIPAIIAIYNQVQVGVQGEAKSPYVLVLTPTRELAMQTEDQAKQLMKGMSHMKTALLVGGLPLPPQLHRLGQGIQFVAGTPGRILEIIRQEGISLHKIRLVVLDEVDTMLQLGFQQQVYDILIHLPDNHQTILTSATIPATIEKMAASLLNDPVFISVGTPSTPCTSVKQVVLWVEDPAKKKKLFAILQDPKHFRPPVVVFVDSKPGADLLAQAVAKSCGLSSASLHGDKPQTERNNILQRLREGAFQVLVSTGLLGRGIDLPGVRLVINFDMPSTVEDYIHQIGRTGRLGASGTAMTFINNNSKKLFVQFTSLLKPLGVVLPQELVNSPHLSYQRQQHRSGQHWGRGSRGQWRGAGASGEQRKPFHRLSGSGGFHHKNKDRENVSDMLKKRKWTFKS